MIKKAIKYTDFNGEEQIEEFYFNLTKTEVAEMQLDEEGGFNTRIEKIVSANNNKEIFDTFKELILGSYGIKSADGKRFIKSEQLKEEFSQTEAFSELVIELATNESKAVDFVKGILPKVN